MTRSIWRALGATTVAVYLAACQDTPTSINVDGDDTNARSSRTARAEGYTRRGELRTGWILGRDRAPKRITYEVQGDLAIFQGDIVIGKARHIATSEEQLRTQLASGARAAVYIDGDGFRWPGGVVPFVIDGGLTNTARVTDAIAMVEQATAGVRFVQRTNEADYIRFRPSFGCSSEIGMVGGEQDINLEEGCTTGNTAHEILHALALFHEHTRCDRDDFVTVVWDNIQAGKEHNFTKQCDDASDHSEYDEGSMMHYPTWGFAIDESKPTLISKRGRDSEMGQREALGPTDIATINFLYGGNNVGPMAAFDVQTGPYYEGDLIRFDAGPSIDIDDATLTYVWDFGDGSCSGTPVPEACTGLEPVHRYTDEGTYAVKLIASDGAASDDTTMQITVLNKAPTVFAGQDTTVSEGAELSRLGLFTDPGNDAWTATVNYGDGGGTQSLALNDWQFTLSHTYVDNGSYTITVTVDDGDGGVSTDNVTVTVLNVAPSVDAGSDLSVVSGNTVTLIGGFTDPGIVDYPWNWTVNWGFGSTSAGTTNTQGASVFSVSRRVCTAGTYAVGVSVTDKDNGTGSDETTLEVSYYQVGIDITPTRSPNPINLGKGGLVPVALLSTPSFNASSVDPSRIVLGDEVGADTPVARQNKGAYHAKVEDVNRDGRPDLVVMFEVNKLVANGDLALGATQLSLRGFLNDNCTNFRGVDAVVVLP
jgi:Astacin (Peptidase family M12A)/PKD domain